MSSRYWRFVHMTTREFLRTHFGEDGHGEQRRSAGCRTSRNRAIAIRK